ncbi:alpha-N-arabinofuranosidase [Actinomadura yumaensis]|uniref:non-reducing end alpha-L-arabinofuranosidase n=1 Tax=Actinomadura yumaensis TaxID=111807 RepID=A0ABW2CL52_9ACTN
MLTAHVSLDPSFRIAPVGRRLFGSFVEHMGRCVYGGIYEPGHAESDADGNRLDVLRLVRELGVGVVRYPGGNFVSGYRWEDGVGPVQDRPRRLDLAWRSIETNDFGLNEFVAWTRLAQLEPMLAVNLGTRGIQEACDLLEYANHPGGTHLSDLRRAHGAPEPHGVRLWCLGNEMDGPWQIGHTTAEDYGRLAAETAKAMRQVDPDIELVACGSSNASMPTFGAWEATVLDHAFEHVDYLSLHAYYEQHGDDRASFLAASAGMDRFIDGVVATADHVAAKKRSRKKLMLSFDEWNLWQESRFAGHTNLEWERAPRLIEDTYTVQDAVVFGSLLMSLLRHSDRVAIACLAQLVNVIGPIRAEPDRPAWAQTIFYPFALTARHARGDVLRVQTATGLYDTTEHGEVPLVDVVATHDAETGDVTVFAMNRHVSEPALLDIDLRAFGDLVVAEHLYLGGDELDAANSIETPERIAPSRGGGHDTDGRRLRASLPPVSWNMLRLVPRS